MGLDVDAVELPEVCLVSLSQAPSFHSVHESAESKTSGTVPQCLE